MNLVRQPERSSLCLAACVAMVAGETLATVVSECVLKMDPPDFEPWMSDSEASRFLSTRSLSYGLAAFPTKKLTGKERSFNVSIPMDEFPAILTVVSLTVTGGCHAVVWCPVRRRVLDPNRSGLHSLKQYTVVHWSVIESVEH